MFSDPATDPKLYAGLGRELTDEEIAEQDLGTDDLTAIDAEDWPRLRVVLEVFFGVGERDGITAAAAWLTEHGIGCRWAKPAAGDATHSQLSRHRAGPAARQRDDDRSDRL